MAALLGVHKNTYARWERDEAGISAEGLLALVERGWSANWILTGSGSERLSDGTSVAAASVPTPIDAGVLAIAMGLLDDLLEAFGDGSSKEDYARHVAEIYDLLMTNEKAVPSKVVEITRYLANNDSSRGKTDAVSEQGGTAGEEHPRERAARGGTRR